MTLHKEVSLALTVQAYVRLQAYMPYLMKEGETQADVHRFVLGLVSAGEIPPQATEFEFDNWLRKRIDLNVPVWTTLEVDAQERPILAKCAKCKTIEVSLIGQGSVNGAPVQGFLVTNGSIDYRCQKCRKGLHRFPFVGYHKANEISRRHLTKKREERKTSVMEEKFSAVA